MSDHDTDLVDAVADAIRRAAFPSTRRDFDQIPATQRERFRNEARAAIDVMLARGGA